MPTTNQKDIASNIDQNKLRQVAGAFATGITVACVEQEDGEIKGITANSFVSISLDPPIVMLSIQNEASFLENCKIGNEIGISILSKEQKNISDQFAGRYQTPTNITFISKGKCHNIEGAMAWYETSIREIIPMGDHQLLFCNVNDLGRQNDSDPLLYYNGYKLIGDAL